MGRPRYTPEDLSAYNGIWFGMWRPLVLGLGNAGSEAVHRGRGDDVVVDGGRAGELDVAQVLALEGERVPQVDPQPRRHPLDQHRREPFEPGVASLAAHVDGQLAERAAG